MIKDIILKQKQEKERLLSLPYIERDREQEAKKWLDSNLIKVILGPRRAGKSVFAFMLLKDKDFAYFNFDDESILNDFNYDELITQLQVVYGDVKIIFFDEIQNLPNWELFVNRLQREGYNLILTGSNARLLSKELATSLTGRHIPIEILPFSFHEFLKAKKFLIDKKEPTSLDKSELFRLLDQYLHNGGYPEIVMNNLDPNGYLDVLFDSLLFKDVVKRYRVRFSPQIEALGVYLINNFSNCFSSRKLAHVLNFKSVVTMEKYLGYLIEAYLIFPLACYSNKAGERLRFFKKNYTVDNGFITAKAIQHSPDLGRMLENLVFMELIKSGLKPSRDFFYYKTRNKKEIDFIVKSKSLDFELIQASYSLSNPETEKREVRALLEASQEIKTKKLTIITWDEKQIINKDGFLIELIPFWERFS